ncbi:MAG TPA: GNAT family N-acetyltransferase [Chlorobaculum parvum]|uniref:GNAT family N-acetyltransferase n=1 Tax=Chlorobaculum parvum TaxID=274539 RepID=A0A7C5HB25_9CHLB|nr:GNAT family N-acetyltransferase [Chlorobaculum parvum]
MPTIRIAEPRDIDACVRLLHLLFSQEHEFVPDSSKQVAGLEMIIGNTSADTVFVCESEGRIVGMVALLNLVSTALGKKVAMLEDMIVEPALRGKGIGSQLLDYACNWANENGYGRITLLTDGDNDTAHHFYETHGFSRSSMVTFRKLLEHDAKEKTPIIQPENSREPEETQAWMCVECGYIYDPAEDDLETNIPPGVCFDKLPGDWCCPVCNSAMNQFKKFDSKL